MTLTRQDFIDDPIGTVYHVKQGSGSNVRCLRWRKNGKTKTWVTRPTEFRTPVKFGLYAYDYITHNNIDRVAHKEKDCDND